jgi:hypothetical protein
MLSKTQRARAQALFAIRISSFPPLVLSPLGAADNFRYAVRGHSCPPTALNIILDEIQEVIMPPKLLVTAIAIILNAITSPFAYADSATEARNLINSQGCKACHTLDGNGGVIAGSFEAMRNKLTRAQIRSQLVNPGRKHGNDKIPDFSHLSENEIDVLVNFIQPKP